jgi:hypothetical protein
MMRFAALGITLALALLPLLRAAGAGCPPDFAPRATNLSTPLAPGEAWTACEHTNRTIAFVSSAGRTTLLLHTRTEPRYVADTASYLNLTKAQVLASPADLLGRQLLARPGGFTLADVAAAVPPIRLGVTRFVGSRGANVDVSIGDALEDLNSLGFPTFSGVIGMHGGRVNVSGGRYEEGLVGGSLPILAFRLADETGDNPGGSFEIVYVPDPQATGQQPVAVRFVRRSSDGKLLAWPTEESDIFPNGAKLLGQRYFDTYIYVPELYGGERDGETRDNFWRLMLENELYWARTWEAEGAMSLSLPGEAGERLQTMAVHSINLDMITRNNVWQPRYGVAPGYGLPLGANNGFQEVFVSSMAAASAWGLHEYGAGALRNWLEQFLRRGGAILEYRGLEMALQGRELSAIAQFVMVCGDDSRCDSRLVLDHLDDLRGAIDILRKRRAKGLLLTATHPAYGLPFGNDEADLWHRTTELPGGERTELPFLSIGSEMYRGFLEFGKALCVLGERYSHADAITEGQKMQQEAAALLEDVNTALERTIAIAAETPGPCPFSFVAGGDSCTVADATQSRELQDRENEPWRTYSELMYSSVLTVNQTRRYLHYAEENDRSMKLGVLSGSGGSASGAQLQTFTIAGFAHGLLVADEVERYLLLLYSIASHGCTRGTFVCAESSSIDRTEKSIKYATPSQLSVPILVRWLMAFEDDSEDSLWLAKAAPREWFEAGQEFAAARVPTRWGQLSFRVASASTGNLLTVHANISLPSAWAWPSGGVKLRLRPQPDVVIDRVTVAGREWSLQAGDWESNVITFTKQTAPSRIEMQQIAVTLCKCATFPSRCPGSCGSAAVVAPRVEAAPDRRHDATAAADSDAADEMPAASVRGAVPVLVAATQTQILWYPLNSATLNADGVSAILMRAQSCPDVNTNTTDTAFVSYDNGSSWALLGPQPVQERICYPFPPGSTDQVMCLPSVDAGLGDATSSGSSTTFLGTIWALEGGNLARGVNRSAVPVTIDYRGAPPLPAGTFMTMFTDGVAAADQSAGGLLMPLMSAAQPRPAAGMTAACRAKVVELCPGVQVHGAQCFACIFAHAKQLEAAHCPAAAGNASSVPNYAYYCAPGTPLPNMLLHSSDGLHWSFRSVVRDPASAISGAVDSGDENALLRLGDGRLMMVMRYDYADFIPSRDPMQGKSVGGLIQVFSRDDGRTWQGAAVLNGTSHPAPGHPGGHPHNVEPKMARLPALGVIVLSSGRCGQYVWWANESDVIAGKQGPLWRSIDIRAHHNAAIGPHRSAWRFEGTCAESTAYTNLNVLGSDPERATEVVVVYDKTHIEVPKTLPKGDEVNYLFSVRLSFSRDETGPAGDARALKHDDDSARVSVDWSRPADGEANGVSRTTVTLQVVSNPILDRTFADGRPNPIHKQAWQSLRDLNASMARFVPWYPYPWKAVAELAAPEPGKNTSWNFTFVLPQFEDFMAAQQGRTTVVNFATQPCWLYDSSNCLVPSNPDASDFNYVRGSSLRDPSAHDLAMYYARLIGFLLNGEMVDENNVTHTNSKTFDLTYYEVFNEGEHGYNSTRYIHDFDAVVSTVRRIADPTHRISWMGSDPGTLTAPFWRWFLNASSHVRALRHDLHQTLGFGAAHYYAGADAIRNDSSSYAGSLFSSADGLVAFVRDQILPGRNATNPDARIDLNELGVILPNDNDPNITAAQGAGIPPIYWNAAAAWFAYVFGQLVQEGVDVLGQSQLAGSPAIPEWGIPLPQFPSVTLLDWRSGLGNARYWVLRLLLRHFGPGDRLFDTNVTIAEPPSAPLSRGSNPFCGNSSQPPYGSAFQSVELTCADPAATIARIVFADWGAPSGSCAAGFAAAANCTDAQPTMEYARQACLGRRHCSLSPCSVDALWCVRSGAQLESEANPACPTPKRFAVSAMCSGADGGHASLSDGPAAGAPVFALGIRSAADGKRKLLLINKADQSATIRVDGLAATSTMELVDPNSAQAAAARGTRREAVTGTRITLLPFAVAVLEV